MKRKIKILVLALKLLVIWTCLEIVKDSKSYMPAFNNEIGIGGSDLIRYSPATPPYVRVRIRRFDLVK